MKKVLCIFLSFSASLLFAVLSEVCTTDSLDKIYELLLSLNDKTLVVFDRDDTLLQGIDCIDPEQRKNFVALWKEIYATEAPESLSTHIAAQEHVLVDTRAPELIRQLQVQKVPVIVLTRGCYGSGPTGKHVEDLCVDVFKKVGIDLQGSFPSYNDVCLMDIKHNGYSPLFKQGILFSNTCDKGEALQAFLKYVDFTPELVIFVDDKLHYVQEVRDAMQKANIPFLGLHYRGATKLTIPDLRTQCYRMCYLLSRDLC